MTSSAAASVPRQPTTSSSGSPASARARFPALSGVAFAVLLAFGWFLSGGDAPDYTASDQAWTNWANENRSSSGVGAFLALLAGIALLPFAATTRSALERVEVTAPGPLQWSRVTFAGAVTGGSGIATAIVMVAAANSEGADANPIVSRAVTTASAGPYLVAAMGFAALLGAAGFVTVKRGVFPRWTGIVALIGAISFSITLLTVVAGTGTDSVFGYGFLPGILALVTWSTATSIASYRAPTTTRPQAQRSGTTDG